MAVNRIRKTVQMFAVATACIARAAVAAVPEPPAAGIPAEPEVLMRGPLHEAFAEQTDRAEKPGSAAQSKPPEPINEVPPVVKPEGDNVIWIPGYWHWNEERSEFDWVSGVWRLAPPGRQWVPGYWTEADGKHVWVPGFWTSAAPEQLDYQPLPPESLEAGPSSPAPGDEFFWAPGCWVWQAPRYAWRAGYWMPSRADWVWTPAYHTWTPRGCVFIDGYWDYPFGLRGILYCPVRFPPHVYRRPGFCYSPIVALDPSEVFLHLFIRAGCSHFYFGDYYGHQHGHHAYVPWYDFRHVGRRYDPFYSHFRVIERHSGIDSISRCHGWHDYYHTHADRRPQRVFAASVQDSASAVQGGTQLAHLLDSSLRKPGSQPRWVSLSDRHRQDLEHRLRELRTQSEGRGKREAVSRITATELGERVLAEGRRLAAQASSAAKEPAETRAARPAEGSELRRAARELLETRQPPTPANSHRAGLVDAVESLIRKPASGVGLENAQGRQPSAASIRERLPAELRAREAKQQDPTHARGVSVPNASPQPAIPDARGSGPPPGGASGPALSEPGRQTQLPGVLRRAFEVKPHNAKSDRAERPLDIPQFRRGPQADPSGSRLPDNHSARPSLTRPTPPQTVPRATVGPSRAEPRPTTPRVGPSRSAPRLDFATPRPHDRPAEPRVTRPGVGPTLGRTSPAVGHSSGPPARVPTLDRVHSAPRFAPEARHPSGSPSRGRHERK